MRRREVLAVGNPGAMRRRWAMCCRWAGNFRPAPTDGGRDAVLGSATRCLGERDAARHVATKKQVG